MNKKRRIEILTAVLILGGTVAVMALISLLG